MPDGPDASTGPGASNTPPADSLEGLDLEAYGEVDRLTEEYLRQAGEPGAVDPEAFVRLYPDAPSMLLAAIEAVGALERGAPRAAASWEGRRVDRFTLRRELGRGGMGVVYEASEEGLDRRVALKLLEGGGDSAAFRARFSREARAAARLEHPAIVPVFGAGEGQGEGGRPVLWYAMRLIEGTALDGLLGRLTSDSDQHSGRVAAESLLLSAGALATTGDSSGRSATSSSETGAIGAGSAQHRAVARIGQRLAGALAYAHAEGVLHRDIKPGNILMDEDGAVYLTDFGLCRVEGEATLTEAADVIGTLRYLPPEGLIRQVDARGDVYGLGLVLYELLTRRQAFPNQERARLIHDIERRDPVPPRRIDGSIPKDLERIVLKAIAKLPEERYGTADALHEDLGAFLAGKPIKARPLGFFYLLRLLVRRHRLAAAVALVSMLALGAGAAAYVVQLRSLLADVTTAEREAVRRGAVASLQYARSQVELGETASAQSTLLAVPDEERGWVWRHLWQEVAFPGPDALVGVRTPLGAASMGSGGVLVWSAVEVQRIELPSLKRLASAAVRIGRGVSVMTESFTGAVPTGQGHGVLIARNDADGILHWSGEPRSKPVVATPLDYDPRLLAANPKAGYAVTATRNQLVRVHLATGEFDVATEPDFFRGEDPVSVAAVLDNGNAIVGTHEGAVMLVDFHAQTKTTLHRHAGRITALLTAGDRLVASGDEGGEVRLMDAPFALGLRPHPRLGHKVHFLALATNGDILAGLGDGTVAALDPMTRAVRFEERLFSSPSVASFPVGEQEHGEGDFAAPRRAVLSSRSRLRELPLEPMVARRVGASSLGMPSPMGGNADGTLAAYVSNDGRLNLVGERSIRTPSEVREVDASFDPSGRLVAAGGLVVEAATGQSLLRWGPPEGQCIASHWIGDDLALLSWSRADGTSADTRRIDLWLWSPADADAEPVWSATPLPQVSWSSYPLTRSVPGTRDLVIADFSGGVLRWDVDGQKPRWSARPHVQVVKAMGLDHARGALFTQGGAAEIVRLSLDTGEPLSEPSPVIDGMTRAGKWFRHLDVSPRTGLIAATSVDHVLHVFDQRDGSEVLRQDFGHERALSASFLPGSEWLAVACGNGDQVLLGSGEEPRWSRTRRHLVDPEPLFRATLDSVEGDDYSALELRTAICTAAFGHSNSRGSTIETLRRRVIGLTDQEVLNRVWQSHTDPLLERFGRFGWVPIAVDERDREMSVGGAAPASER